MKRQRTSSVYKTVERLGEYGFGTPGTLCTIEKVIRKTAAYCNVSQLSAGKAVLSHFDWLPSFISFHTKSVRLLLFF